MTSVSRSAWLTFDEIDLPDIGRLCNATDVVALADSIRMLGLQVPLTVIERNGRYLLIAGCHRLEALRVIGEERLPARIVDFDDVEARLWTISENLHRTELSVIQRSEMIAEYAKLTRERLEAQKHAPIDQAQLCGKMPRADRQGVSAQLAPKPQSGRPESGDRLVARELNISRREIERSQTIASLPNEVKAKAADLGIHDNQSALLQAAKAPTPEAQVETLVRRGTCRRRPAGRFVRQLKNLKNISAGTFCQWIKMTTPNDQTRIIRLLEMAAAILRQEHEVEAASDTDN